jgi:hypothetical protein
MGYTVTDTVSCRLLPSQIAELRALAATEKVSLSRFVSGLCLETIQRSEKDHTHAQSLRTHKASVTRADDSSEPSFTPVAKIRSRVPRVRKSAYR